MITVFGKNVAKKKNSKKSSSVTLYNRIIIILEIYPVLRLARTYKFIRARVGLWFIVYAPLEYKLMVYDRTNCNISDYDKMLISCAILCHIYYYTIPYYEW